MQTDENRRAGEPAHDILAAEAFAVPAPDDAIDADLFRELQFDPAFASLVGNPAMAIAEFSIVDVFEPVKL